MKKTGDKGFWMLAAVIALLAAAAAGVCILFFRMPPGADPGSFSATEPTAAAETRGGDTPVLTAPEDFLPDHLMLGAAIPEAGIQNEEGLTVRIADLTAETENGIWMVFWASWCPDCTRQFETLKEMEALAEEYNVKLILTDRLEADRETREAAREKLKEAHAESPCWFDPEGECYHLFGMHEIPSSVVIDRSGTVKAYTNGTRTPGEYRGMMNDACIGRDTAGKAYILEHLSNGRGGIYTSDRVGAESPAGTDILSESQGLMMLCALKSDDRALFDSLWEFTRSSLMPDGLPAWYVTENGETASTNALIDDLRIWYALSLAADRWGANYGEEAERLKENIRKAGINRDGAYVDYTDLKTGGQAGSISLCYLDPVILRRIAGNDAVMQTAAENGIRILTGGRISDTFPLYYSSYSYETGSYSEADLNTAEALYTLWKLSRADLLPDDTAEWLRTRVREGNLAARYRTDGTVVRGYEYYSTAVYALAALIAMETGDRNMLETAHRRMERLRNNDADDPLYGAYAQKNAEIRSFDQLIPLLVNSGRIGETQK